MHELRLLNDLYGHPTPLLYLHHALTLSTHYRLQHILCHIHFLSSSHRGIVVGWSGWTATRSLCSKFSHSSLISSRSHVSRVIASSGRRCRECCPRACRVITLTPHTRGVARRVLVARLLHSGISIGVVVGIATIAVVVVAASPGVVTVVSIVAAVVVKAVVVVGVVALLLRLVACVGSCTGGICGLRRCLCVVRGCSSKGFS